jgi:hypothetical protein
VVVLIKKATMKKVLFISLFLVFGCTVLFAENNPQPVTTKIQKVTVFKSGAQVSRTASISLEKGRQKLVFKSLSPILDPNSVELNITNGVRILTLNVRSNITDSIPEHPNNPALDAEIEDLRQKVELDNAMADVYIKQEEMLLKNQSIGGNLGIKTQELKDAMEYSEAKLTEIKRIRLSHANLLQQHKNQLEKLQKQASKNKSFQTKLVSEIVVEIECKEDLKATFGLNYKVKNASWSIAYDLRLVDTSSPLTLTYNAKITQTTGEDWNNVLLVLSTDNPNQPTQAPSLNPWVLGQNPPAPRSAFVEIANREIIGKVTDYQTGEGIPYANVMVIANGRNLAGAATDLEGNFKINVTEPGTTLRINSIGYEMAEIPISGAVIMAQLHVKATALKEVQVVSSKVERYSENQSVSMDVIKSAPGVSYSYSSNYQPVVTQLIPFKESDLTSALVYQIEIPYTVKASGEEVKVAYKESELETVYEHLAVPKLDLNAYLIAHLPNWDRYGLINGEMNLYLYGTYKGRSLLGIEGYAKDTFDISLGCDKSITMERKVLKKFKKKEFLSSDRTEEREYEIVIKNGKSLPIQLTVLDQVPISPFDGLKIDKVIAEEAKLNPKTGELRWLQQMDPGASKKLHFSYHLKVPKNFNLLE